MKYLSWLARAVIAGAALFLLAAAAIVADGLSDHLGRSDVGVVLGSKVELDGRPSPRLAARLDEAAALYRRGLFAAVIVSGGVGKEGFDEGRVMAAYLVAHGVPAGAIITDSHGDTTWATAVNTAAIMRAHGWTRATAITQYFHISRTRLALKRQGIAVVYTGHPSHFEARDPWAIAREVAGYVSYLARARVAG